MTVALQIDSLSKSVLTREGKSFEIIGELSLQIRGGEILCVLGASGCGKSTLLRILAGLDQQSSGTIRSDISRPGAQLGYLQQSERLFSWRSILENIALGAELLGRPKKQSRDEAGRLLEKVGLAEFANVRPSAISGGMAQRVLFARLLSTRPKLLLLDEPLGQLDLLGRRTLAAMLKDYARETEAAVLVVTHSVEEAVFLGDRVCILARRPSKFARGFAFDSRWMIEGYEIADSERPFEQILDATMEVLRA